MPWQRLMLEVACSVNTRSQVAALATTKASRKQIKSHLLQGVLDLGTEVNGPGHTCDAAQTEIVNEIEALMDIGSNPAYPSTPQAQLNPIQVGQYLMQHITTCRHVHRPESGDYGISDKAHMTKKAPLGLGQTCLIANELPDMHGALSATSFASGHGSVKPRLPANPMRSPAML